MKAMQKEKIRTAFTHGGWRTACVHTDLPFCPSISDSFHLKEITILLLLLLLETKDVLYLFISFGECTRRKKRKCITATLHGAVCPPSPSTPSSPHTNYIIPRSTFSLRFSYCVDLSFHLQTRLPRHTRCSTSCVGRILCLKLTFYPKRSCGAVAPLAKVFASSAFLELLSVIFLESIICFGLVILLLVPNRIVCMRIMISVVIVPVVP